MKKYLMTGVILSAFGIVCYANADSNAGQVKEQAEKEVVKDCPKQENLDIYSQLQEMVNQIGLTDAQSKEIRGLVQEEQIRVASIQQKINENRNELFRTNFTVPYNQIKYDQIVAKLTNLDKQIINEHSQLMSAINVKLTNEQREKIFKLIPKRRHTQNSSGFGFGPGFGFGFGQ